MQRIFITGASSGLGMALAKTYAEQGAYLGLVARRESLLRELQNSLPHPERHRIYALDVCDSQALAVAAQDFMQAHGGVDIVIANAGVSQGTLTEHVEDLPVFKHVMAVNVNAMVATFAPFIGALTQTAAKGGQARLVGISSVAGVRGLPGAAAYSASKAAVTSYCEALRIELRASGVKVVTIAPGFVETPMTAQNGFSMPFLMNSNDFAQRAIKVIAQGASYRIIPWQMAGVGLLLRCLPNALYDFLLSRAPRKPRSGKSAPGDGAPSS